MTPYNAQRYALAGIASLTLGAVLALGTVACEPQGRPTPDPVRPPSQVQVMPEECLVVHGQPPYNVRHNGRVVHVPAGRVQVDRLLGLDTPSLRRGCIKIRARYLADHR